MAGSRARCTFADKIISMKKILALALGTVLFSTAIFAQKTYTLDKYHSRVNFSATHFGISHVEGNFKSIDATLTAAKEDLTDAQITFTADVNTINTEVEYRDNDLKSPAYFDAAKYGSITFKSTAFKKVSGKKYKLAGNITIHGVTKPIVFDVLFNGTAITAMKKPTAGFTLSGKLNRLDFGVGGPAISSGISNEILLSANVEFTIGN
jgi:polyisoprenoid-binding protein YceI